jgi:hypothetical protein
VSPLGTHLVTAPELAVGLLATLLTLATLLATLATLLSALLALAAAGLLFLTLTARSLLTSALLTTNLIFFTIVCHDIPSPVRCVDCQSVPSLRTDVHFVMLHSFKTDCSNCTMY